MKFSPRFISVVNHTLERRRPYGFHAPCHDDMFCSKSVIHDEPPLVFSTSQEINSPVASEVIFTAYTVRMMNTPRTFACSPVFLQMVNGKMLRRLRHDREVQRPHRLQSIRQLHSLKTFLFQVARRRVKVLEQALKRHKLSVPESKDKAITLDNAEPYVVADEELEVHSAESTDDEEEYADRVLKQVESGLVTTAVNATSVGGGDDTDEDLEVVHVDLRAPTITPGSRQLEYSASQSTAPPGPSSSEGDQKHSTRAKKGSRRKGRMAASAEETGKASESIGPVLPPNPKASKQCCVIC